MSTDFIRERLNDPNSKKMEALKWLEQSDGRNTLGEMLSNEESIELIKEAYRVGALEVLAIEIDEYEHPDGVYENTGKLLVKLPSEPRQRQSVFDWCAIRAEEAGFDGETENGQTHIFVALD